jgi:peptidoglycan/xylan/chitin deacetylase (PgdA/CDA1 family)
MGASLSVATLLYHHVGPVTQETCRGLTVDPAAFSRQIATLSAMGYTAILPDDFAAHVKGEKEVPLRSVMITFDDAYADLVAHAFPVLERYSFPTTVFVPTALIGSTIQCSPKNPYARMELMTAEDIASWARRGVTFGAHSRTHADLTDLEPASAIDEITGSKNDLEEITGNAVTSFAYPFGKFNPAIESVVESNFTTAFTIEEGMNESTTSLTALNRTMVQHGDSLVDVLLRARYGRSVLQRVRAAIRI